jgi:BirA family transcriptional regulator, biotin operon repressor / biotin---[acetyl-CoA-carboxylase] ligase
MEIIRLNAIGSTNTYAKNLLAENKIVNETCIVTSNQTSGRGMQTNLWESEPNTNLTFSLICFPDFLPPGKQFQLNKVISLSVFDLLQEIIPDDNLSIKWPNDIYIGHKKAAGILIETSIIGQKLKWVVIGIGINVNQSEFSNDLPNPTSLIHFTQSEINLDTLLDNYLKLFDQRYKQLTDKKTEEIDVEYLSALFRSGILSKFVYKGKEIMARITGVNEFGWLRLLTADDKILECEMKEIVFVM